MRRQPLKPAGTETTRRQPLKPAGTETTRVHRYGKPANAQSRDCLRVSAPLKLLEQREPKVRKLVGCTGFAPSTKPLVENPEVGKVETKLTPSTLSR
jgi:hypothetical protein